MTRRDKIIAALAYVFAGICGGGGVWAAGHSLPQEYPREVISDRNQPTYFWDSRTNLCFAFLKNRNYYGDVDSITNVPCTAKVQRVIEGK